MASAGRTRPVLVVPGGGPFADAVREFDRRFGLPASTVRKLAAPIQSLLDRGEDIWSSACDSSLRAVGRRYSVLRTEREVRVLLAPGRVQSLDEALRELKPQWWQLDPPHGVLVVR